MQFSGNTAQEAAPDMVFLAGGPPRGCRGCRSRRRCWLAGADGLQPGFQVCLGVAVPQAVQPDITGPARRADGNVLAVPSLDLIPNAPEFPQKGLQRIGPTQGGINISAHRVPDGGLARPLRAASAMVRVFQVRFNDG